MSPKYIQKLTDWQSFRSFGDSVTSEIRSKIGTGHQFSNNMPFFRPGLSTRFLYFQLKNIKDGAGDLVWWESACLVCTVPWVQSPLCPTRIPHHLQQNRCVYVPSQVNVFPPSLLSVVIPLYVTHSRITCCPKQDWDAGYHAFSKFLTCFLFPLLP